MYRTNKAIYTTTKMLILTIYNMCIINLRRVAGIIIMLHSIIFMGVIYVALVFIRQVLFTFSIIFIWITSRHN